MSSTMKLAQRYAFEIRQRQIDARLEEMEAKEIQVPNLRYPITHEPQPEAPVQALPTWKVDNNYDSAFLAPVGTYSATTMANVARGLRARRKRYTSTYEVYIAQQQVNAAVSIHAGPTRYKETEFHYGLTNNVYDGASHFNAGMYPVQPTSEVTIYLASIGASSGYWQGYNANTYSDHPATPKLANLIKMGNAISIRVYEHRVKLPPLDYKFVKAARIKQIHYGYTKGKVNDQPVGYAVLKNKTLNAMVEAYWAPKQIYDKHVKDQLKLGLASESYDEYKKLKFLAYAETKKFLVDTEPDGYLAALGLIKQALLDLMQQEEERQFNEQMAATLSALNEVVFDDDVEYPHQDTTAPIIKAPDVKYSYTFDKPYLVIDSGRFTPINVTSVIQTKLDSYYYSVDEFRLPERDAMEEELTLALLAYEDIKRRLNIEFDSHRYFRIKKNMRKAYDAAVVATPFLIDDLYLIYESALEELRIKIGCYIKHPVVQRLTKLSEYIYQLRLHVDVQPVSHGNIDAKQSIEDAYDQHASSFID